MIACCLTALLGFSVGLAAPPQEVALSLDESVPLLPMTFDDFLNQLKEDTDAAMATHCGRVDNRVGFQFASLEIGSEDGSDSTIAGSRLRLARVAELLEQHPEARILIEGHVGPSAPPQIAQEYSENRAHVVARILQEEYHICPQRMLTRGWGSSVSEAAQASTHPNAAAAQHGFGWAELFVVLTPCHMDAVFFFPERPDYYAIYPPPPPPAPRTLPSSHPIFYMQPGARVGERVALHLFEPRYKLLLQRALATDQTFIFCARAPLPTAASTSSHQMLDTAAGGGDGCVAVVIVRADLYEDGEADVWGLATESVTLRDVMVEPETGGLMSTTTPLATAMTSAKAGEAILGATPRDAAQEGGTLEAAIAMHEARHGGGSRADGKAGKRTRIGACPVVLHVAIFAAAALVGLVVTRCFRTPHGQGELRFCPAPAPNPKRVVVETAPLPGKVVVVPCQTAEPLRV